MGKTTFTVEPGKQEVVMTREFNAPRELVFKAFIDPEAIPKWWGPAYLTTTVDIMESRPGGRWRYVQRDPEGNEYAFHGIYHTVAAPEKLVFTFEFEGMPGHVILETVTLEERDGKTFLTDQSVFQSVEDRDGMIASGMEQGSTEGLDLLAALVELA
ncbi:MAG: SRPBCC family protein [Pleurocapsa minor GSE-CHR-MK-17-07R]|jgi:uncharacterized protein YndB with AHSA1/START domain|nr:SRPBCC family protein [Pleurocapsa minor GSE-CHR-MK 17-07R]